MYNRMKLVFLAIFAMAMMTAGAVIAGDTSVNGSVVIRGGVFRLGPDLYLHDDWGHEPVGIKRFFLVDGCDLRVVFVTNPDAQIVTAMADEDAQMSALGVMAGIHGGAQSLTVEMYRDGNKVCADSALFEGKNADVWVQAVARNP